jgi:oligoribonuclease NrnB/cAMP/cGMP phosphodiesterase (DHH superfamily)
MKVVDTAYDLNRIQFEQQNREYIYYMLKEARKYIGIENSHIALDESIYKIQKSFFLQDDINNTIDNAISKYIVNLLKENKDKYTVFYKDHKGILTYSVKNSSILGNEFLVQNEDYDFFLNVNSKKNISLRATGNCDVSLLAQTVFDGGGHINASGGRYKELKNSFIYETIKEQVEVKLGK